MVAVFVLVISLLAVAGGMVCRLHSWLPCSCGVNFPRRHVVTLLMAVEDLMVV